MLNLDEYNEHWDRYFAEEIRAGRIDEVVENPSFMNVPRRAQQPSSAGLIEWAWIDERKLASR
jgi:hypothetical protein